MEEPIPFAPAESPSPRRRLPPLFWALTLLLALLVIVGVGSIFYYFTLTRAAAPAAGHDSPWDNLAAEDVLAGLAVWSLAEAPPEELFRQAMAIDAVETAAAATLTTAALTDEQRLGWLKLLARRQAAAGQQPQAAGLNQLTADLALLAPDLGDVQRAEALIAAAAVWDVLGRGADAHSLLVEATRVAEIGPELAPAIRRRLLEQIAEVYTTLGDHAAARAVRALPADAPALPPAALPGPDPLAFLATPPPYNDEIIRFQAARVRQAQAYVDAWVARSGQIGRGEAQMLEGALIDEDLARAVYYDQRLRDPALTPADRAALLWDRIHWLLIKYRAASGLYGAPLVANWIGERPAIRQNLHDAFVALTATLRAQIDALPAAEQAPAAHLLHRRLLIWARTGLYPDPDLRSLANALNDALRRWPDPPPLLPRALVEGGDQVSFTLAGPATKN